MKKKMTNWEELQWRGLVKDVAGEGIEDKINNESVTFYWGTDPTADSLHLGHYSSLVTAKRLMKMGHKPILLCGGATGRIGDPRPTAEREMISIDTINVKKQKGANIFLIILIIIIIVGLLIYLVLRLLGYKIYFNFAMIGAFFRGIGESIKRAFDR